MNIITATDSYKFTHYGMYPEDTEYVYSYFESRRGAQYQETVFFGLQYFLKKFLAGCVVTKEKIDQAEERINAHIGPGTFNREMWEYILDEYDGRLPVEIKAVPEGTVVPINNVMMTVENTDPKCASLTNYLETLLSQVWYPSTVATKSRDIKQLLGQYLKETSDNPDAISFMLHDFGFRGVSSYMSAELGGAAHLVNFRGSDTFPGIECIMDYYDTSDMPAFSVRATEHSIMTARGEEGEKEVFKQLLSDNPTGILSIVIDSYDYRRFISEYAAEFKDQILARDGKVVFRPDSGDPKGVSLDVAVRLATVFGTTRNSKNFKVLNEKVGLLWGDGVDTDGINDILNTLFMHGFSAENIVFGMGGHLLQVLNRDTQRNAFKSSAQCRSGVWYDIKKNPLDKSKVSKSGKLALIESDGIYQTVKAPVTNDKLRTVFRNGKLYNQLRFEEVRSNAK